MNEIIEKDKTGNSLLKRLLGYAVKWVLPLALTILLVAYMFKKVNFGEMMTIIRSGVDYWWILCAMGISVCSHIFRAMRWRIQLRSLGMNPQMLPLSCSIFGCYALNLVFPRLGEVWRCTYVSTREKGSLTTVFGSMVADRLSDSVMVLFLTLLTFVIATPAINAFLIKYPLGVGLVELVSSLGFWGAVIAVILVVWGVFYFGSNLKIVIKIKKVISELWQGFASVGRMKGKWAFIAYTFAIWSCYFLQLYVAFFAFSFTRELCFEPGNAFGLTPCLVAFVLSSIGMAIPSNGGLGPWNIAVIFGLAIYGISDADGTAFSMLVWSGQTVMLILLGIFTMAYISLSKRKQKS